MVGNKLRATPKSTYIKFWHHTTLALFKYLYYERLWVQTWFEHNLRIQHEYLNSLDLITNEILLLIILLVHFRTMHFIPDQLLSVLRQSEEAKRKTGQVDGSAFGRSLFIETSSPLDILRVVIIQGLWLPKIEILFQTQPFQMVGGKPYIQPKEPF